VTTAAPHPTRVAALAGGVGAARFLRGLTRVVPPHQVTAIVNTGDDRNFYGTHVSPDIDIVTYTLAGRVDPVRGYGLDGDRDFATCHHRTLCLRLGAGLAEATDEIRRAFGVETRILPMSEDPCPTTVELAGEKRVHFEEYLVRDGAPDDVTAVDLSAAERARPAPGVLDALSGAHAIVICPSNPVVSIGPILAVQGVRAAMAGSGAPIVAISPIVGGAPVKGPADRLLRGVGIEVSARGVAGLYREFIDAFVLDERDAEQSADIEAMDLRVRVVDTLMRDAAAAARVAEAALALASEL
jgi:LPPG:FO 2-phospho-L-lactate transferase